MVNRLPIEENVLMDLRPTEQERDHVCGLARRLLAAIAQSGKAEGMVVGSIARQIHGFVETGSRCIHAL